jgi:GxxExxY protein
MGIDKSADGSQTRRAMRIDGPQQDVTFKIIGAAMNVHNALGPGLKEIAYHKAMSLELERAELGFEEEKAVDIHLDGSSVGLLYLDHLVEATVVVEEKAFSHLPTEEEQAQVITYLAATRFPVGVLLNFGRMRLEYRRTLPPRSMDEWQNRVRRYVWTPDRR